MNDGFYSLSSKRLPAGLSLEIHQGFDFEVPLSQANYNFLDYRFFHVEGATAFTRVYLDELAMSEELRSSLDISPDFEPYDRQKLPDNFISSIILTMAAFGWDAHYDDFESEKVTLRNLYDKDKIDTVLSEWIKRMDEMKV